MSIEDPQDVPDVWRQHFKRQNIEFTYRDLDRNVEGVALNTIRRALQGIGTPSRRVAASIADALGMTADEFYATRAKVSGDEPTTPFTLPTRADLLNQRERDAVLGIVNALLDARDRHDTDQLASDADRPPASGTPREDDKGEKTARVVHIKHDGLNEQQSSQEAGDVVHMVPPPAGTAPYTLAASAHWPDGVDVDASGTADEYQAWLDDGSPDTWRVYRERRNAGLRPAALDYGPDDEGESERAAREQDEAAEESQEEGE
ncbi:helix-turn-helix transcriptional regulator [Gordonia cholesterolivorans]|uniref:HTH cro/C1-type domain-containing protein n=1 Tax=Gordonia cholesterolivorans TaxID=559625 RepID=A0ABN3HCP9_9ACTN